MKTRAFKVCGWLNLHLAQLLPILDKLGHSLGICLGG